MGTSPGPTKQHSNASYTPQPQYYIEPPKQQLHSPQPQYHYQQHPKQQQQHSWPHQPPQQAQYYFPPQQHQHALSTSPSTGAPQQQQFLAELEAPQTAPAPKTRPTSSSSASPAAGQSEVTVFEMSGDPAPAKPTTPIPVFVSGSVSADSNDAGEKPLIQANPWDFFLGGGPPPGSGSTSPSKEGNADTVLSVKPLKIVKTGPSSFKPDQDPESKQGNRPQSGIVDHAAEQPVYPQQPPAVGLPAQRGSEASAESVPLAPAPLNISRLPPPATQPPPIPTGSPPVIIPPAGTYPPHSPGSVRLSTPGAQITLPLHPRPTSASPPRPLSAGTSNAATPLSPAHTGATIAASPQQPQHATAHAPQATCSQAPSQAYTSFVSPVFVHAALPPTLPLDSYFPQQPSYATTSAQHSPQASVSGTAQDASQTVQPVTYASPPPSYDQAISQSRPENAMPLSSQIPTTAPLCPMPTVSSVFSYPYSPADIGVPTPMPSLQHPCNLQSPPIPQPYHVNGLQAYKLTPLPLPPRTSPTLGQSHPQNPYGPPPTRPNYVAPPSGPGKSTSGIFSTATARKLLNKTTDFVDQAITPYLQDHRYKPPYGQYNHYSYQYQYPSNRPLQPGQYHPQTTQVYAPTQPTYATPQVSRENPDMPRPA